MSPERTEADIRVNLFNSLLTTPHRDLDKVAKAHKTVFDQDPRFYIRFGAWYFDKGEIRDHKEMFIAVLCTALEVKEFTTDEGKKVKIGIGDRPSRNVGLALLRKLPPYEVCRVVDSIKNSTTLPRSTKTEVTRYLKEREADPEKFDNAVLIARKCLKHLYAGLHIKPSLRADSILFKNKPPKTSKLFALKEIAKMKDPSEQAASIIENKIPYRIASTIIKSMTPSVMVALIDAMSAQELINNISSIKRHGSFNNPKVKQLVADKLQKAKRAKRVSAFKAKKAVEASGVKGEIKEALEEVTEEQVKVKGEIKRATALLCDASGSMEKAIEVAVRVGSMVSSICTSDLYVYAFDTMAHRIEIPGDKLTDWEESFKGIHAGGSTSCGVAIRQMRKRKEYVEQIIFITDEDENSSPYFKDEYELYTEEMGVKPSLMFIKLGSFSDHLEQQCRDLRIEFDAYIFKGDYYALPSIIPFITKGSRLELIEAIMAYPLPVRLLA